MDSSRLIASQLHLRGFEAPPAGTYDGLPGGAGVLATQGSEVYLAGMDILAPDGSGESTVRSWGAYSYYQTKISRTLDLGARLDYYEPDVEPYAGGTDSALWPLATSVPDAKQWLAVVYATWSESPWVHWRVEYEHQWNGDLGPDDDTVWFQCVFAAGPHKHDRY